jgi:hypothetical protein
MAGGVEARLDDKKERFRSEYHTPRPIRPITTD